MFLLIPLIVGASIALSQCGREAVSNNSMEKIYEDEGVPVRVETIEPGLFEMKLSYHAVLSGIEESSVHAMVSDKVEMIYAQVGDYVEEDQVLISFPPDTPSAKYQQAKVAYENAKLTYERIEQLFQTGGISEQDRDNAKAAYDVAAADWDTVRGMVQVEAPIEGYVTRINVRESDNVDLGDMLMTISQIDRMKTKVWASDSEVGSIRIGQRATAHWNGVEIDGSVVQVDMAMDKDTQAFGVVLEFENNERILKVGVTADISITTYRNTESLVVERKNILRVGDRYFVYVAENGQARQRDVTLGRQHGLDVVIREGLTMGDRLITEGQLLLEQGSKIKIVQ
jgi:RND family efflux transporter MFP subunit